jgi:hypothetical protein
MSNAIYSQLIPTALERSQQIPWEAWEVPSRDEWRRASVVMARCVLEQILGCLSDRDVAMLGRWSRMHVGAPFKPALAR